MPQGRHRVNALLARGEDEKWRYTLVHALANHLQKLLIQDVVLDGQPNKVRH